MKVKEILFKRCNKCKKIKNKEDFSTRSNRKDGKGLKHNCKQCFREIGKENYLILKTKQKIEENKVSINTKFCKKCNKILDISNFRFSKLNKNIPNKQCNKCNDLQKCHFFKYEYGISLEEKKEMITNNFNQCNICKVVFKNESEAYLDHCHKSKKIRGILCRACNTGIGNFKDNIELLKNSIRYLEKYNT